MLELWSLRKRFVSLSMSFTVVLSIQNTVQLPSAGVLLYLKIIHLTSHLKNRRTLYLWQLNRQILCRTACFENWGCYVERRTTRNSKWSIKGSVVISPDKTHAFKVPCSSGLNREAVENVWSSQWISKGWTGVVSVWPIRPDGFRGQCLNYHDEAVGLRYSEWLRPTLTGM